MREALGVTASTYEHEVQVLPHVAEGCIGQKASCLRFPPMVRDCLIRHSQQWKFIKRNSLSAPIVSAGGTTAVKLGRSVLP